MAQNNFPIYSFNKGEISRHALGRLDAESMQLAAESQVNWMPMVLGPMGMRPGLAYLGSVNDDAQAIIRPFIFATNDKALLEFTDQVLRFWVDDELLAIDSVATTIANGTFVTSASWTLTSTGGGTAQVVSNVLLVDAESVGSSALATQAVSVSVANSTVVHRLRIEVLRGPVGFSIGTASGLADIFARVDLGTGTHSIAFTPGTTTFYPQLFAVTKAQAWVDSMVIESAGTIELPTPWRTADLPYINYVQSGDVLFVACDGYQQRKIERRDDNSWSIVRYEPVGGPYRVKPTWARDVAIRSDGAYGGNVTVTARESFFKSTDLNTIIAVQTSRVAMSQKLGKLGATCEPFQVTGVNTTDRTFAYTFTGTGFTGTFVLERSIISADSGYVTVQTFTGTASNTIDDSATHANRIVWYRTRMTAYTAGYVAIAILYGGGSGNRAQARIRSVDSVNQVTTEEFDYFENNGADSYTTDFRIADWSDEFGWPSAVAIHDGRLWWGGRDKLWGSISDDYNNFEETFEGEAGPLNRSFGYGPFANVNWIMSLQRMIVGRDASCVSVRSSSFDAPITPIDFTMKDCTTHGSAAGLPVVKVDSSGIYVDKSGRRVHELRYDVDSQDYGTRDLTVLNPDIGLEGFVDLAVQRQLDTRIHLVRGDGTVAVLSYEKGAVEAWWRIETDGEVESVCVLPGELEDHVYYVVKRTIDGVDKRYLEKFARQDECQGDAVNKIADSFIVYSGVATTTITGLSHLEGEDVVVWGDGKDLGTYTVDGGQIIDLSESVVSAVVGLSYEARFKSTKLGIGATRGSAMFQKKRIEGLGLLLADTHYQGIEIGQDFDTMDPLPMVEDGTTTPDNTIWTSFDTPMIPVPGRWGTDSRLCLRATAPRPATVLAAVMAVSTHEKP